MKLENIDILRAISIACVVMGHGCLQLNCEPVGRFCGYLFVQIFFLISAFLLGLKYGDSPLNMRFLLKRWKRLSAVYYPFLIISMIIILLIGGTVTVKNAFTHFLYINYFVQDNMCDIAFGHLWYISMMMLCYVLLVIMCGLPKSSSLGSVIDGCTRGKGLGVLCAITLVICALCMKVHVPCRIPIVLASYFVLFKRAHDVNLYFEKCKSIRIPNILFAVSNVICLVLFLYWDLNSKLLPRDLIILATSCCWLFFFMTSLRNVKCGKVMGFLSAISFELYLVHHPFVLGNYSMLSSNVLTGNIWLNAVLTLFVIVTLSYVLNKVGIITMKLINK